MKANCTQILAEKLHIRYSNKPAKQLLYLRARKHLSKFSHGKAIDIGCQYMECKPLYRTDKYIGVDLAESKINKGLKRFPDAEGVISDLRDLNIKGDIVGCFQLIGVNSVFDDTYGNSYTKSVADLIDTTKNGGSLIFNVGGSAIGSEKEIKDLLENNFNRVITEKIRFSKTKRSVGVALLTAILANKGLMSTSQDEMSYILFVAVDKI